MKRSDLLKTAFALISRPEPVFSVFSLFFLYFSCYKNTVTKVYENCLIFVDDNRRGPEPKKTVLPNKLGVSFKIDEANIFNGNS